MRGTCRGGKCPWIEVGRLEDVQQPKSLMLWRCASSGGRVFTSHTCTHIRTAAADAETSTVTDTFVERAIRRANIVPATGPGYPGICTCGCTHSEEMVEELREQGGPAALAAVNKVLAKIAEREQLGLATENMMAHRARLIDLAQELTQDVK